MSSLQEPSKEIVQETVQEKVQETIQPQVKLSSKKKKNHKSRKIGIRKNKTIKKTNFKYSLIRPEECFCIFLDYQPAIFTGVYSHNKTDLRSNFFLYANIVKAYKCAHLLSAVLTASYNGPIMPEIQAQFPDEKPIERTSINSWLDKRVRDAVKNSGKKTIVIGGLWTSMCVAFPAIELAKEGYKVVVLTDACGDLTKEAHDMAVMRMVQAGIIPMTTAVLLGEFQADWADSGTADYASYLFGNFTAAMDGWRLIKYHNNQITYINPSQKPEDLTPHYPPKMAPYAIPPIPQNTEEENKKEAKSSF